MKLPNKFIRNFCRIVTFFLKNGLAPGIKEPLHATATTYKFIFWASVVCTQWRRPGAQFGGNGNIFGGPKFLNDVFRTKISIFTPKNSDDLFLSHRPGFSDFCSLFSDSSYLLYCVECRIS